MNRHIFEMKREEKSYLNPPPVTKDQVERIYEPNPKTERQERIAGRTIGKAIRRLLRKHGDIEKL